MDKYVENPLVRLALVILSTLRLTRFVTSDWLGEWTISGPAHRWAAKYEGEAIERSQADWLGRDRDGVSYPVSDDGVYSESWLAGWQYWYDKTGPISKQARLVKGLDCPFCVGFWIGGLILLGEVLTRTKPLRWARPLWTFGLAMLSLNEVVGHVSSRIDG